MKTSVVKHYFINEKIKDTYLAEQLKINHRLVLGEINIGGYFNSPEEAIKDAFQHDQRFVILHWISSYFELESINKILVEYENLFDYEHAIYGHLIDCQAKDGQGYFGFQPITIALDLKLLNYKSADEIKFGHQSNEPQTLSKLIRSTENVTGNYTPLNLNKGDGEVIIQNFTRPGWALIDYAAKNNLEVISLGGNVRKLKTPLYGTDHADDFAMMSDLFSKLGILENQTMSEWFIRILTNNQKSQVNLELVNEELLTEQEVVDGKTVVMYPSLKDIAKVCSKSNRVFVITENKDEFSKLQFLIKDQKILQKYGYNFDVSKCQIIFEDVFKNKNKFVKFCRQESVDTIYLKGFLLRRMNIGLNQSKDYIKTRLPTVNFIE